VELEKEMNNHCEQLELQNAINNDMSDTGWMGVFIFLTQLTSIYHKLLCRKLNN
jgi:hypothetical protein